MRIRFLVLAYPFVEVAAAVGVAQLIGWAWTAVLLLIGVPVGASILRGQARSAMLDMTELVRRGQLPGFGVAGGVVAGLLIMIPGFVTDVLGGVLLIPAVRRAIWGGNPLADAAGSGTVIQGVVVETRMKDSEPRSEPPEAITPT